MVAMASNFDRHNKLYIRDSVLRRSMFDSLHRFLTVTQTLSSCERSRSQRSALVCNDIHISITMDYSISNALKIAIEGQNSRAHFAPEKCALLYSSKKKIVTKIMANIAIAHLLKSQP